MNFPIKIKFKHHSVPPTKGGCNQPLWLCILIPIKVTDKVTPEEYKEGFGIARADIVEGKFHLVYERRAALDDGTVPIQDNWDLGEEVAKVLGYKKIIVKAGTYKVDFSKYPEFGETYFDADLQK